jgi:hypothetical protein
MSDNELLCSAWTGKVPRPKAPDGPSLAALRESRVLAREQDAAVADTELQHALATTREAPTFTNKAVGAWGVVRGSFMKGVTRAALATTRSIDSVATLIERTSFKRYFPGILESGEKLEATYSCKALHGGVTVPGTLFITTKHVCFHNAGTVALLLPLQDVVSLCEAVSVWTYDGRPYLIPKPAAEVITDALQLFASDKRLIEFVNIAPVAADAAAESTNYQFKHRAAASMCHTAVYQMWVDCVANVPMEGIEYSAL